MNSKKTDAQVKASTDMFDLEADMTPVVLDWLRGRDYTCWTEAPIFGEAGGCCGYADIIGVQLDDERCCQRLEEGPVTPWGAPWHCAQRLLEPPGGQVPDWFPLFDDVLAVELKLNLSDWETALSQASRCSSCVKNTYAAFPMPTAREVLEGRMMEQWPSGEVYIRDRYWNIGIMGVSPDGCEVIREPRDESVPGIASMLHVSVKQVVNVGERAWRYWREENDE